MKTAKPKPTTDDTAIFAMITELAVLDQREFALDPVMRRRQGLPVDRQACEDASYARADMEQQIIHNTDAATTKGHRAKIKMVVDAGFDAYALVAIAWVLGHEAGRLGLGKAMPRCLQRLADEG